MECKYKPAFFEEKHKGYIAGHFKRHKLKVKGQPKLRCLLPSKMDGGCGEHIFKTIIDPHLKNLEALEDPKGITIFDIQDKFEVVAEGFKNIRFMEDDTLTELGQKFIEQFKIFAELQRQFKVDMEDSKLTEENQARM